MGRKPMNISAKQLSLLLNRLSGGHRLCLSRTAGFT